MVLSWQFLFLTAIPTALQAQGPQPLAYLGRVAVADPPVNFDVSGAFKVALVNTDGTTTSWSNSPDTVPADGEPDAAVSLTVTRGLYSVLLGDATVGSQLQTS